VIGPPPCDADGFSLSNSDDVTPLLSWCARAVAHGVMSAHGANAISQLAKAQSQVRDVSLTNRFNRLRVLAEQMGAELRELRAHRDHCVANHGRSS
jgi:hypothetical protein